MYLTLKNETWLILMSLTASRHDLDLNYIVSAVLGGTSYSRIADVETMRLGKVVTKNTVVGVVRDIREGKIKPSRMPDDTYIYGNEDEVDKLPLFVGHPSIEGNTLVVSDLHSPYIDKPFAERSGDVARYFGIDQMVIAGDTFHGEQKSPHRIKGSIIKPTNIEQDAKIVMEYLTYVRNRGIKSVLILPGNHDLWLYKDAGGTYKFRTIIKGLIDNIRGLDIYVTEYDRVTLTTNNGEDWVIPHQRDYSQNPLVIGNILVNKYRANVIIPHQHISAKGISAFNHNIIIDIGGLHNPLMFAYGQLKTSTSREHQQGFATVVDDWGELWTPDPRITDWSRIYSGR